MNRAWFSLLLLFDPLVGFTADTTQTRLSFTMHIGIRVQQSGVLTPNDTSSVQMQQNDAFTYDIDVSHNWDSPDPKGDGAPDNLDQGGRLVDPHEVVVRTLNRPPAGNSPSSVGGGPST